MQVKNQVLVDFNLAVAKADCQTAKFSGHTVCYVTTCFTGLFSYSLESKTIIPNSKDRFEALPHADHEWYRLELSRPFIRPYLHVISPFDHPSYG